jgi:hypothetical protein
MRIVSMQTDDTFILIDQSFAVVEEEAIHSVKLMIKTRDVVEPVLSRKDQNRSGPTTSTYSLADRPR